jgi:hypothetical protein
MNPSLSPDPLPRDVPGLLVAMVVLAGLFVWSWWRRRQGGSPLAPGVVWPLAGVAFLIFAAVVSRKLGPAKEPSASAASWPVVTGRVVRSVMRTSPVGTSGHDWNSTPRGPGVGIRFGKSRYLDLLYRFEVEGRGYEGSYVTPGNFRVGEQDESLARRYPQGRLVPVHYNPADPSDAVLDPVAVRPGDNSMPWKLAVVAVGCFVLAWWDGRPRIVNRLDGEWE